MSYRPSSNLKVWRVRISAKNIERSNRGGAVIINKDTKDAKSVRFLSTGTVPNVHAAKLLFAPGLVTVQENHQFAALTRLVLIELTKVN